MITFEGIFDESIYFFNLTSSFFTIGTITSSFSPISKALTKSALF